MNIFSKRPGIWLLVWLALILISALTVQYGQNAAVALVATMVLMFLTGLLILELLTSMAKVLFVELKDANNFQSEITIPKLGSFVVENEKTSLRIPEAHFWGLIGVILAMLPILFPYGALKDDWQTRVCFGPFFIFAGFFIGYLSGPFLLSVATAMILGLTNPLNIKTDTIGGFLFFLLGIGLGFIFFTWPAIKLTDRFSFIVKPGRPTSNIKTITHLEATPFPTNSLQKKKSSGTSKKKQVGIWLVITVVVGLIAKVLITKKPRS
ncbi:MAG: hypothetical protein WAM60_15900 [Candidatus Promineifilaceae bacterium]